MVGGLELRLAGRFCHLKTTRPGPFLLTRQADPPYSPGGPFLLGRRTLLTRQADPSYSAGGPLLLAWRTPITLALAFSFSLLARLGGNYLLGSAGITCSTLRILLARLGGYYLLGGDFGAACSLTQVFLHDWPWGLYPLPTNQAYSGGSGGFPGVRQCV